MPEQSTRSTRKSLTHAPDRVHEEQQRPYFNYIKFILIESDIAGQHTDAARFLSLDEFTSYVSMCDECRHHHDLEAMSCENFCSVSASLSVT